MALPARKSPNRVVAERFKDVQDIYKGNPKYVKELEGYRKKAGEKPLTFINKFSEELIFREIPHEVSEILSESNLTPEQRTIKVKAYLLSHDYIKTMFGVRDMNIEEKEVLFNSLFRIITLILKNQSSLSKIVRASDAPKPQASSLYNLSPQRAAEKDIDLKANSQATKKARFSKGKSLKDNSVGITQRNLQAQQALGKQRFLQALSAKGEVLKQRQIEEAFNKKEQERRQLNAKVAKKTDKEIKAYEESIEQQRRLRQNSANTFDSRRIQGSEYGLNQEELINNFPHNAPRPQESSVGITRKNENARERIRTYANPEVKMPNGVVTNYNGNGKSSLERKAPQRELPKTESVNKMIADYDAHLDILISRGRLRASDKVKMLEFFKRQIAANESNARKILDGALKLSETRKAYFANEDAIRSVNGLKKQFEELKDFSIDEIKTINDLVVKLKSGDKDYLTKLTELADSIKFKAKDRLLDVNIIDDLLGTEARIRKYIMIIDLVLKNPGHFAKDLQELFYWMSDKEDSDLSKLQTFVYTVASGTRRPSPEFCDLEDWNKLNNYADIENLYGVKRLNFLRSINNAQELKAFFESEKYLQVFPPEKVIMPESKSLEKLSVYKNIRKLSKKEVVNKLKKVKGVEISSKSLADSEPLTDAELEERYSKIKEPESENIRNENKEQKNALLREARKRDMVLARNIENNRQIINSLLLILERLDLETYRKISKNLNAALNLIKIEDLAQLEFRSGQAIKGLIDQVLETSLNNLKKEDIPSRLKIVDDLLKEFEELFGREQLKDNKDKLQIFVANLREFQIETKFLGTKNLNRLEQWINLSDFKRHIDELKKYIEEAKENLKSEDLQQLNDLLSKGEKTYRILDLLFSNKDVFSKNVFENFFDFFYTHKDSLDKVIERAEFLIRRHKINNSQNVQLPSIEEGSTFKTIAEEEGLTLKDSLPQIEEPVVRELQGTKANAQTLNQVDEPENFSLNGAKKHFRSSQEIIPEISPQQLERERRKMVRVAERIVKKLKVSEYMLESFLKRAQRTVVFDKGNFSLDNLDFSLLKFVKAEGYIAAQFKERSSNKDQSIGFGIGDVSVITNKREISNINHFLGDEITSTPEHRNINALEKVLGIIMAQKDGSLIVYRLPEEEHVEEQDSEKSQKERIVLDRLARRKAESRNRAVDPQVQARRAMQGVSTKIVKELEPEPEQSIVRIGEDRIRSDKVSPDDLISEEENARLNAQREQRKTETTTEERLRVANLKEEMESDIFLTTNKREVRSEQGIGADRVGLTPIRGEEKVVDEPLEGVGAERIGITPIRPRRFESKFTEKQLQEIDDLTYRYSKMLDFLINLKQINNEEKQNRLLRFFEYIDNYGFDKTMKVYSDSVKQTEAEYLWKNQPYERSTPAKLELDNKVIFSAIGRLKEELKKKIFESLNQGAEIELTIDPINNPLIEIQSVTKDSLIIPSGILGDTPYEFKKGELVILGRKEFTVVYPDGRVETTELNRRFKDTVSRVHGMFMLTDHGMIYSELGKFRKSKDWKKLEGKALGDKIREKMEDAEIISEPEEEIPDLPKSEEINLNKIKDLISRLPKELSETIASRINAEYSGFSKDPEINPLIDIRKTNDGNYEIPSKIPIPLFRNTLYILGRDGFNIVYPNGKVENKEMKVPLNKNISRIHGMFIITDTGLEYVKLGQFRNTLNKANGKTLFGKIEAEEIELEDSNILKRLEQEVEDGDIKPLIKGLSRRLEETNEFDNLESRVQELAELKKIFEEFENMTEVPGFSPDVVRGFLESSERTAYPSIGSMGKTTFDEKFQIKTDDNKSFYFTNISGQIISKKIKMDDGQYICFGDQIIKYNNGLLSRLFSTSNYTLKEPLRSIIIILKKKGLIVVYTKKLISEDPLKQQEAIINPVKPVSEEPIKPKEVSNPEPIPKATNGLKTLQDFGTEIEYLDYLLQNADEKILMDAFNERKISFRGRVSDENHYKELLRRNLTLERMPTLIRFIESLPSDKYGRYVTEAYIEFADFYLKNNKFNESAKMFGKLYFTVQNEFGLRFVREGIARNNLEFANNIRMQISDESIRTKASYLIRKAKRNYYSVEDYIYENFNYFYKDYANVDSKDFESEFSELVARAITDNAANFISAEKVIKAGEANAINKILLDPKASEVLKEKIRTKFGEGVIKFLEKIRKDLTEAGRHMFEVTAATTYAFFAEFNKILTDEQKSELIKLILDPKHRMAYGLIAGTSPHGRFIKETSYINSISSQTQRDFALEFMKLIYSNGDSEIKKMVNIYLDRPTFLIQNKEDLQAFKSFIAAQK